MKFFSAFFAVKLFISSLAFAQVQQDLNRFEINPQHTIEIVYFDGFYKRKIDGVIQRAIGISESIAGETPEEIARNYVKSKWSELGFTTQFDQNIGNIKIQPLNSGTVVRFRQAFKGLRVDQREFVLKLDKMNLVRSFQNTTIPIDLNYDVVSEIFEREATFRIKQHLGLLEEPRFIKTELMLHAVDLEPILCWQINLVSSKTNTDWECYVDAKTGEIVEVQNNTNFINGTGTVFSPNPTNTANVPYGTGGFEDNSDATNADLEGELVSVTLLDIEENNGIYKLKGPYAEVIGDLYDQSSPDFSFTRDNEAFEAVMCYYHLDKSLRYINNNLGVQLSPLQYAGGVRFDPHLGNSAAYNATTGNLSFGGDNSSVDAGEDAVIILHELGHGIHNWLAGGNHSQGQGLSEALSDYWAMSGVRDCGDSDGYNEWEPEYHTVLQWGLMPWIANFNRNTNFSGNYCNLINGGTANSPIIGQYMSTTLMKIHSDLGKYKTDLLVIETMPNLIDGDVTHLWQAGVFLYETAIQLGYSENDLCIIYQHLDDVLCISQASTSTQAPSGNTGDVYIKDTQCDNGDEVNLDDGPMWLSEDIWVRHDQDGGLEHQNPEYKINSPNWLYVRVRGKGCNSLSDAKLRLYMSKGSTGIVWPSMWNNYYISGPNGSVLAGDEITTTPISIPVIEPGGEWIVSIPWYPPNPANFNTNVHHWCLLGRIESNDDPMFIPETPWIHPNTQNNNNIAWKNISIFDNDPNNVPPDPISVYLGCHEAFQGGHLEIQTAQNSIGNFIHEVGSLFIELTEPLKSKWIEYGMEGEGFQISEDGRLEVIDENFSIDAISIESCDEFVNVYFEPYNPDRFYAFDLIQYDNSGVMVGGERFEYKPQLELENRSTIRQEKINSDFFVLYPNPAKDVIQIEIMKTDVEVSAFEIFDFLGNRVMRERLVEGVLQNGGRIDVSHLFAGLYCVVAIDNNGNTVDNIIFTKE